MRKSIASIFIAILAVAAGANAQDRPQLASHQPAATAPQGTPPVVANPVSPRTTRDSAQLTPAERERVERQGGQPLLWLKTMAAAHEANQANQANRKSQVSTPDKKSQAKSR